MALGSALVDRARIVSMQSTGRKVDGQSRAVSVTGPWFKARLELPQAPEANFGQRRRATQRPSLMCGVRDEEGNEIRFGAQDAIEVDSPQLGQAIWQVTAEPAPMRKKRTVIGWEVALARQEEHDGAGSL